MESASSASATRASDSHFSPPLLPSMQNVVFTVEQGAA